MFLPYEGGILMKVLIIILLILVVLFILFVGVCVLLYFIIMGFLDILEQPSAKEVRAEKARKEKNERERIERQNRELREFRELTEKYSNSQLLTKIYDSIKEYYELNQLMCVRIQRDRIVCEYYEGIWKHRLQTGKKELFFLDMGYEKISGYLPAKAFATALQAKLGDEYAVSLWEIGYDQYWGVRYRFAEYFNPELKETTY